MNGWVPRRLCLLLGCLLAVAVRCGDRPPAATPQTLPAATADATDVTADLAALDANLADLGAVPADCPGGPGCVCASHEDCSSGVCADSASTATGKACAFPFSVGCAPGYVVFTAQVGEGAMVCVPAAPKLCNPCEVDDDCKALGTGGALCIDRGSDGRYCGMACPTAGCPTGFACQQATSGSGVQAKQCQPVGPDGSLVACPCSMAAVAMQLATPCQVVAKTVAGAVIGACSGVRTCGSAGLGPCDGKVPQLETCDGKDNDCNGKTDDGELCGDGLPCTADACTAAQCAHTTQAANCDDGNACTVGDACTAGQCAAGTLVVCDDLNDCTDDACAPATGKCVYLASAATLACDDGDPCTTGDLCAGGACAAGVGKNCDGGSCNVGQCNKATGKCQFTSKADQSPCSDGNPCTGGDACLSAVCIGAPKACDDANPCTSDSCSPATDCTHTFADGAACDDGLKFTVGDVCEQGACVPGVDTKLCKSTADCAKYDDGNLCNGTLFCNKATGVCQLNPKTAVYCPTALDTLCQQNQCQPALGVCAVVAINELKPCDDGNLCTTGEACSQGVCKPSESGDTCLCKADADCKAFEDGDVCNGSLFCNLAQKKCQLNPKTVVVCSSAQNGPCAVNTCNKATGQCAMLATQGAVPCDADGSPCTPFDACAGGKCLADTANICECLVDADCAGKDDGNLCNGLPYCNKALNKCQVNPATLVVCATGLDNTCSQTVCQPASGQCEKVALPGPCSDGDACTVGDVCKAGLCLAGTVTDCDDANACTSDGCDAKAGCTHADKSKSCEDKNGCTSDSCDATIGCVNASNTAACDDGTACTSPDACKAGKCAGTAVNCDDNNGCTADSCDAAAGCVNTPNAATCSDGTACTSGDTCAAGKCVGAMVKCDDGNACTADGCDTVAGCAFVALPAGATCGTGDGCVSAPTCKGTVCVSGSPQVWSKAFGGGLDDLARAMVAVPDGLLLVGPAASTSLPGGQKSAGLNDMWLTRTDLAGNLLWSKTYGGSANDWAWAAAAVTNGFVVAGASESKDLPGGAGNAGDNDGWLVRTDSDGKLLWSKTYGGSGGDVIGPVAALVDGFVFAGQTTSTNLPGGVKSAGVEDLWLVRTESLGNPLWQKAYGGSGTESAAALVVLPDGFAVVGSCASGTLPGGPGYKGWEDAWLVRTDTAGNIMWSNTFGGTGRDYGDAILALPDGFLLAGKTTSLDLPGGNKTAGLNDGWLIRTDASGNLLWHKTFGGSTEDSFRDVLAVPDGFMLVGQAQSPDLPGAPKTGNDYDAWLLRTDLAGTLLWNRRLGGTGAEQAAVIVALANGFAVAGETSSTNWPDGPKAIGGHDVWVARSDAWGNVSCGIAGTCATKPAAACSDANPCTADLCDGIKGCVHTPLPEGALCAVGKVCGAGATCGG